MKMMGRLGYAREAGVPTIGYVSVLYCDEHGRAVAHVEIERRKWDRATTAERAAILSGFRVWEVGPEPLRCPRCGKVVFDPRDCEEKTWTRYYRCEGCRRRFKVTTLGGAPSGAVEAIG